MKKACACSYSSPCLLTELICRGKNVSEHVNGSAWRLWATPHARLVIFTSRYHGNDLVKAGMGDMYDYVEGV